MVESFGYCARLLGFVLYQLSICQEVAGNRLMFGAPLVVAIVLIAILSTLFLRVPPNKGDLIAAADRASAALITNELEERVRSALRQSSDAELQAMIAEGTRLQAVLRE